MARSEDLSSAAATRGIDRDVLLIASSSDSGATLPTGTAEYECFSMRTTFVTAEAHALVRFRRAIERRALWMAEDAARELPNLPLEDALQLGGP
jgi:hypothetical protein